MRDIMDLLDDEHIIINLIEATLICLILPAGSR